MFRVIFLVISCGVIGADLVENLESTLSECSDIIEAVDDFVDSHLTPDDKRRLGKGKDAEPSLVEQVEGKLGTCTAVVEAVEEFNMKFSPEEDEDIGVIFEDPIVLNVGGKFFTTSLATLRSNSGSLLREMFQTNSSTTCSPDGSFFIDRDPSTFGLVLEYLRNDDMLVPSKDKGLRLQVLEDAEYFQLPEGVMEYLRWSSLDDGMDLSFSEFSFINKELKGVSKQLGGLLYQATKDGSSSSDFHSRCDNKGATVVIIETSAGNVFGGFTEQPWNSGGWSSSTISFLFQLRPVMMRYNKKNAGNYATYRHSSYGPTFGNGHDLHIASNCLFYATSFYNTNGGNAYSFPTSALNGGERRFRVQDYVVLQAEAW